MFLKNLYEKYFGNKQSDTKKKDKTKKKDSDAKEVNIHKKTTTVDIKNDKLKNTTGEKEVVQRPRNA